MSRTYSAVSPQRANSASGPGERPTDATGRVPAWLPWATSGVLLAALLALLLRPGAAPEPSRSLRASLVVPESLYVHSFGFWAGPPALSNDGRFIAFSGVSDDGLQQIYLRSIDNLECRPIEGTRNGYYPFWSPDGKEIGFFTTDGKLKRVGASGGPPITIATVRNPRGGSWGRDGTILFTIDYQFPLYRVPASGGTPEQITALDSSRNESSHRFPSFLPDGTHFLYFNRVASSSGEAEGHAVYVASLDKSVNKLLVRTDAPAVYASGHLLYMRGTTLLAQEMDERSFELRGSPAVVAEQVTNDASFNLAVFSASQTGILTYQSGLARSGARLLLLDRTGKQVGTLGELSEHFRPRFSPNGRQVISSFFDIRSFRLNIWFYDVASGTHSKSTSGMGEDFPVWSPDGSRIAYSKRSAGESFAAVCEKPFSQIGGEALVYVADEQLMKGFFGPSDWSRDGSTLLVSGTRYESATSDVIAVTMAGKHTATKFLKSEFGEWDARFSPDDEWVAYTSNESGEQEVYLRKFRETGTRSWKVSNGGGLFPRWGKNREDLLYVSSDNKLMQATLKYGADGVEVTSVRTLFAMPPFLEDYDVSRDGTTIVVNRFLEVRRSTPVTIVNNWVEGLKKE